MKYPILFSLFLSANYGLAQSYGIFAGARTTALGNSAVSLSDIWSTHTNQAGLAFLEKPEVALSYNARYQIQELSLGFMGAALPTRLGTFGLAARHFGFDLFQQTKVGLSYARSFGSRLAAGVQLSLEQTAVSEGSSGTALFAEVGLLAKASDEVTIGVQVVNPTRSFLEVETRERLPTVLNLGFNYHFREDARLSFQVRAMAEYQERYGLGAEWPLLEWLTVRAGAALQHADLMPSAGLGISWKNLGVDAAWQQHPILGSDLTYALRYQF